MRNATVLTLAAALTAAAAPPPALAQEEGDPGEEDELDGEFEDFDEEFEEEFETDVDEEVLGPDRPAEDRSDVVEEPMPPAFPGPEQWPRADIRRPLVLSPGMVELHANVQASLSSGAVLDPVSLAPDVYYGVHERVTVGLVHTRFVPLAGTVPDAAARIPGAIAAQTSRAGSPVPHAGDGLCLGDSCSNVYDNVGASALVALGAARGEVQLAVHAGAGAVTLDPLALAGRIGVKGRVRFGKLAIVLDPAVRLGITERGGLNEDVVIVPVTVELQATDTLALLASSGFYAPLGDLQAGLKVPADVGALYSVTAPLDVGASIGFSALAGGDDAPGADDRFANVFAIYRL